MGQGSNSLFLVNTVFIRGKRNILIFVHLYNIRSTIFRKEYSFSKRQGIYEKATYYVLDIISTPTFKVFFCHLYTWNLELTAAWYVIYLKVLYQLFILTLKEYSVIRSFCIYSIRDYLEHSF